MAMDFNKALTTAVESIERPPVPPIGHYVWHITKVPTMEKRGQDDMYQVVEFPLKAVKVFEDANDVDADELKAYGKVENITNRLTFMFDTTDEAKFAQTLFRLKTFLKEHARVDMDDKTALKEALNSAANKRFVGELRHRPDKQNPEVIYAEIGRTAPLE